jgi:hypothetical protein
VITIFTLPKPFDGHIGMIQNNAIGSWRALRPECQVILLGNEPGIEEAAKRWDVEWVPEVARTKWGTPLLDSAFSIAAGKAKHDWICYINGDIILFNDFTMLPSKAHSEKTLFVGQRWDYHATQLMDFNAPDWEKNFRNEIAARGSLHPPAGSDYFLFHKKSGLSKLPPFAVGRPGWDNWFLFNARRTGCAVVDASQSLTVVHQNHDYRHVPAARKGYDGPEGDENLKYLSECRYRCTLADATHLLSDGHVRRAWTYRHFRRSLYRWKLNLLGRDEGIAHQLQTASAGSQGR